MASLNKVMLIGRIGQDPESRSTANGNKVINVSLATSEKYNGEEKTEWHKLIFWNKLAEIVEKYVKKGSQIFIEGKIQTREWQNKEGAKQYATEIVCHQMQMLDSKNSMQPSQDNFQNNQRQMPDDFMEDDIPF